jgi:hypothetical protein
MRHAEPDRRFPPLPDFAALLADFGQPVAVLENPRQGATRRVGSAGVDGRLWAIDVEYLDGVTRLALVRTVRRVPAPTAQSEPLVLLRDALVYVAANATTASDSADGPHERMRAQVAVMDEARAAVTAQTPQETTLAIDGAPHPAWRLDCRGYTGLVADLGPRGALICVTDSRSAGDIRLATTSDADD